MKRNSRSKSRNSKTQEIDNTVMTKHDNSKDLNGSTVNEMNALPSDSLTSTELSKKRNALACSSNDTELAESAPPPKKRHLTEMSRNHIKAQKRTNESSFDETSEMSRIKVPKMTDISQRSWTKISNAQTLNSNSDSDETQLNFVVVSYNIAALSALLSSSSVKGSSGTSSVFDVQHNSLMEELAFINADILCLQHVSNIYWNILKKALDECGYRGDVITSDDATSIGVATLYRSKRFVQLSIDSDKLSKLCFNNIPHNNSLDDGTMKSIKEYMDEPDTYIITLLKDREQQRLLIVGNTRLSDDKSDKPDLKCVQAVGLFWRIHDMVCKIKSDQLNNNSQTGQMSSPCWILCGEFNGSVDSPVYQICRDGYPNETSIEQLQATKTVLIGADNQSLVNLIWNSFQHPFTDSGNSYIECASKSGNDYIWMSEGALKTEKVLMPSGSCGHPSVAAVTGAAAANADHLSLACGLAFMT